MKFRYLRTSDVAKTVGVHPNTVRLYEEWGFLPPIPRSPGGYRLFTPAHLDQMRLARSAMHITPLGGDVRKLTLDIVLQAAADDLGDAHEKAYQLLAALQAERAQARVAADLLERWAKGTPADTTTGLLSIGQTAKLLGVTTDTLRNWERNGLINVPRDPHNRYRRYRAPQIGRLRVIRTLRRARYSLMAILRMLRHLDQELGGSLRQVLDQPTPDEDVFFATDRWLSTLDELEKHANDMIAQLEAMIEKRQA